MVLRIRPSAADYFSPLPPASSVLVSEPSAGAAALLSDSTAEGADSVSSELQPIVGMIKQAANRKLLMRFIFFLLLSLMMPSSGQVELTAHATIQPIAACVGVQWMKAGEMAGTKGLWDWRT